MLSGGTLAGRVGVEGSPPKACCGQRRARAPESAAQKPRASRYVRIGHYQCIVQQGDFQANLDKVVEGLKLAEEAKLDILSFPETSLAGFFANETDARKYAFAIDSPQMKELLRRTAGFNTLFLIGFGELRGDDLYNTVAVIERGKLLGRYSKAFPVVRYFTPGREFPVFEKKGLKFGVVICADGGYIEPCRILALKGARVIFAPHHNFVRSPIRHYQRVRNDHVARAVENGVFFVRGNNVVPDNQLKLEGHGDHIGYGYGDSYVVDYNGQIVASAGLYKEYLMIYNFDLQKSYLGEPARRSRWSAAALLPALKEALGPSPGRHPNDRRREHKVGGNEDNKRNDTVLANGK